MCCVQGRCTRSIFKELLLRNCAYKTPCWKSQNVFESWNWCVSATLVCLTYHMLVLLPIMPIARFYANVVFALFSCFVSCFVYYCVQWFHSKFFTLIYFMYINTLKISKWMKYVVRVIFILTYLILSKAPFMFQISLFRLWTLSTQHYSWNLHVVRRWWPFCWQEATVTFSVWGCQNGFS